MKSKHSSCFTVLMVFFLFTFSCNSSPQKSEVDENTVQETTSETVRAPPLTTTVEVTGGTIEGVAQDGIFSYKGIPFAAPPVGNLRWKAPAPVRPWSGVKKADAFCSVRMQPSRSMGNSAQISEDCLYLNVWTPAKKANRRTT